MENLRQVLYNFHRNGGGSQPVAISTSATVTCASITDKNNSNNTSTATVLQQHHSHIQMPLLGNRGDTTSSIPGVVSAATHSSATATINNPILQQHVALVPNNHSAVANNSDVEQQRVKAQVQQRLNRANMSPMNIPITNMEPPIDGVIANGGDGAVAITIGAAGGEGPSCSAASAANKSSDDSSDCQG